MRTRPTPKVSEMIVSKKWVMAICGIVVMLLSGPMGISAEPIDPVEYMLGYYNLETGEADTVYVEGNPPVYGSAVDVIEAVSEVVALINANRKLAGRIPLIINPVLNHVAQVHSNIMRNQTCFAHQCPGELSPSKRACVAGYRSYGLADYNSDLIGIYSGGPPPKKAACFVSEVIAAGYPYPKSVVNAWMKSPGHYAILMDPGMREIGVGLAYGGLYRRYWTVDLGRQPRTIYVFINNDDPGTTDRRVTLHLPNENIQKWGGTAVRFQEIMISNNPNFENAFWQPYASHKTWILTKRTGFKTVYVKFKDNDGNEFLTGDIIFLKQNVD